MPLRGPPPDRAGPSHTQSRLEAAAASSKKRKRAAALVKSRGGRNAASAAPPAEETGESTAHAAIGSNAKEIKRMSGDVLAACTRHGQLPRAVALFHQLVAAGGPPHPSSGAALLDSLCARGQWEDHEPMSPRLALAASLTTWLPR